jgi:hypothetical protein
MTGLASGTYLIRFENKKGKSGTIRLKKDWDLSYPSIF